MPIKENDMTTFRILALALLGSLMTGCGSEPADVDADQDADNDQAVSESAPETSSDITLMTAADGWVDLHDLTMPEPGRAWLEVEGERVEFEIECNGPGVIDHSDDVPPMMASRLFNAQFNGEGRLANGWRVTISGSRRVVDENEARQDLRFYRYPGMDRASLDLMVFDGDGLANGSFQGGPNDQNRTGEGLPMLHVQPDGSFTAVTELVSMATMIPGTHAFHQHALSGPVSLAGRCPAPWEESPPPGGISALF